MRISVRYDDDQKPGANASREPDLCNLDVYVNTREDLITVQHIVNALLSVLPPKSATEGALTARQGA